MASGGALFWEVEMSIQFDESSSAFSKVPDFEADGLAGFDLDISIVESGSEADQLIYLTDDGCGATCQSACSTTCP